MAYAAFNEDTYYARWCDQRNQRCSEVWPKSCPQIQRETLYAEAVEAYNERYSMGVEEYYALYANADMDKADKYAEKLAGPEPKIEDF
jgi:hypothetical protein